MCLSCLGDNGVLADRTNGDNAAVVLRLDGENVSDRSSSGPSNVIRRLAGDPMGLLCGVSSVFTTESGKVTIPLTHCKTDS